MKKSLLPSLSLLAFVLCIAWGGVSLGYSSRCAEIYWTWKAAIIVTDFLFFLGIVVWLVRLIKSPL